MQFRHSMNDVMQLAAAKVGIDGWEAYQWEAADAGGSVLRGCVPSGIYTRGPRKGQPKFRPPTPGTERMVVVIRDELNTAAARYENATVKCWDCKGEGKEIASISIRTGTTYRTCQRCKGTGSPPDADYADVARLAARG